MPLLTISEAARQLRLRPSAIRYYEKMGILPAPVRVSGQRRYDSNMLYRLAVVQRARQLGFALDEIRTLFFGFDHGTGAGQRWHKLAERKLTQLAAIAEEIRTMQTLLKRMQQKCRCETLEMCGKAILAKGFGEAKRPPMRIV